MTRLAGSLAHAKAESAEVRYATDAIVLVDGGDVADLKRAAEENARRRVRLCAHHSRDDRLHEMLIVHTHDTYVRPHKHLGKSESFHIIEGDVDVVAGGEVGDETATPAAHPHDRDDDFLVGPVGRSRGAERRQGAHGSRRAS